MGEVEKSTTVLLADANVLIDYIAVDRTVLRLISQRVGPVKVARQVLSTVRGLSSSDCTGLGIEIVHPTSELLDAASGPRSGVSLEDYLCFLLCQAEGWTLATNDRRLLRVCEGSGVATKRGLRLLVDLASQKAMTPSKALDLALAIQKANPFHITDAILEIFRAELTKL